MSSVSFVAIAAAAGLFPAGATSGVALEVVLTPRMDPVHTGGTIRIDVLVTNPGTTAAEDVEVIFFFEDIAGAEFSGCSSADETTCVLGAIPPGKSHPVLVSGLVARPGGASVTALVTAGSATTESSASVGTTGPRCTMMGTLSDDRISGTRGNDVLCAGLGNDVIGGRAGNDRILAGAGDDRILAGWGNDRISGGGDRDTLVFDQGGAVWVDLLAGQARGPGEKLIVAIEAVRGTSGDDVLLGSGRAEVMEGRAGADVIAGRRGPDEILGGPGEDDLSGGPGSDSVAGGRGVDTCLKGPELSGCERRWRPVVMADVAGLLVYRPARRIEGVGYHESLFSTAAAMVPRGAGYAVMSSRGRGTPATSAGDVVMTSSEKALAPVSGRVVSVTPYRLYCGSENDVRILIKPRGHPGVRVMVLHVTGVRVRPGQRVSYAYTVLGTARSFVSFTDQVDRYFPGGYPHVHVEVEKPAASPLPGC
ncbi:MAG: hypothetical protein ABI571_02705 [Actinomycetota bacterium]